MWHQSHVINFRERFCRHAPVNRAVVDAHNSLLSMRISRLRKEGVVERLSDGRDIICVVDFGASWEPIDVMEAMWIPHDCRRELLLWISARA
jgi:predicted transcriptional regulator of viral defense system